MLRRTWLVGLLSVGCGTGAAAEAVRAEAPSASTALGEAPCRDVKGGGEPLIVDWKAEQRGDLEVAMKDGVAVVAYTCQTVKVLPDCHIDGKYGFIGMTKKEETVRLESSDEIKANLPFTGGQIGGQLERGATLEIAMVMVGKKRTTWQGPTKADLKGTCDGATHYVRGATVGAFALESGSQAKLRTAAEIFSIGASAASSSGKNVQNKDGDPSDCGHAVPDADKPPPQCGTAIRLVLAPIGAAPAAPAEAPKAAPVEAEAQCPQGLVLAQGKCTAATAALPHQCQRGNADECKAQCELGHPGSCTTLGELLAERRDAGARAPLEKACNANDARGCTRLGMLSATSDAAGAAKLYEKGCNGADAMGCRVLGAAYLAGNGVGKDAARANKLFGQACDGGDDLGCAELGKMLVVEGKDLGKALTLHKRACDGSVIASCNAAGDLWETGGAGIGKNAMIAQMLYRRGCYGGSPDACGSLGRSILAQPQGANEGEAKSYLERACMQRVQTACAVLKVVFNDSRPVFPDPTEKQALFKSCTMGVARDCATSGLLDVAMGNPVMGKPSLQRACTMGEAWGCYLQKKVK